MSVAVPVIPNSANVLYDEHKLYELLLACQATLEGQNNSAIVSFSQTIDSLDPLLVLSVLTEEHQTFSFVQPNEIYFYWENRHKKESILGYGATQSFFLNTADRFIRSQELVKDCFEKIIRIGEQDISSSSPHFFCGFTFFSESKEINPPFPSALIFLPKLQIINKKNQCVLTLNLLLNQQTNYQKIANLIVRQVEAISTLCHSRKYFLNSENSIHPKTQFKMARNFKKAVAATLNSIQLNQFNKLVLAHALDLVSPINFSLINCLNNLRKYHPDCHIFALNNGRENCFIGASPERLISVNNQQLITDALAGSAPRGKTAIADAHLAQTLLKSEKERREHQVVVELITQRLIKLGLTPHCSPLKVLQLSNIQHLWTPIYTQLKPHIHPLEIVAQLHPTPAVAGFPTDIACEEIRRYETFERGLYAAPLGWIDYQGNSEFIVGIRSALISGNWARLYAGAGIVEGSEPEKELAEIQLKFQALLKAL